jgi:hypothetical protein
MMIITATLSLMKTMCIKGAIKGDQVNQSQSSAAALMKMGLTVCLSMVDRPFR